ncbi:MAG TPA: ATP-binding protein, partial [Tepidisphaeraceae bacterium]|nr:ATP-binding protein [Tepidisphaeraceae bacterium]
MDTNARSEHDYRLLEQKLRRYSELYDLAPVACVTLNSEGVIEELNLTAATMLGVTRQRATRMPFVCYVAPESRRTFLNYMLQCRTAGEHSIELQIIGRPDRLIDVQLSTRAYDEAGKRILPTAIVDMTALRSAEAERRRLENENQKFQIDTAAKDRFFAMLSHELRTPLTPVLAAITSDEFLRDLPEHARATVDMIFRNVQHETRLIDDLLDITRITNNKINLRREFLDLHQILEQTAQSLADEIKSRQIAIQINLRATSTKAEADPARLRQIFSNLLKNAIKFTSTGGQIILQSENTGPNKITISVIDTGVGMDAKALSRLFQPFEQAAPAVGGGLGLGLAIARGLTEAHGGAIFANSLGPGRGCSFHVTLPTTSAATQPAPAAKPVKSQHPARSLKILLVDDHADTARIMAHLLRRQGHDVRVAMSVREAVKLAGERFDVLVSDIGLPDGSGLDVMQAIAAHYPTAGIALSGFGSSEDIERSKAAGFYEHLTKPVDFPLLLSAINQVSLL